MKPFTGRQSIESFLLQRMRKIIGFLSIPIDERFLILTILKVYPFYKWTLDVYVIRRCCGYAFIVEKLS